MTHKATIPIIALAAACLLSLAGCAGQPPAPASPTTHGQGAPRQETVSTQDPRAQVEIVELNDSELAARQLLEEADHYSSLKTISCAGDALSADTLTALAQVFPQAELSYCVTVGTQVTPASTQELDLSGEDPAQAEAIAQSLGKLLRLSQINFLSPDGTCAWGLDALDLLRHAAPEADFLCSFDLFGQRLTSQDDRIEYVNTDIGSEGLAQLRRMLPYLSSCTYLLLDDCGVDNEEMDRLRQDFPQMKVVWRVHAGNYSVLTDTEIVRPGNGMGHDRYTSVFRYCNDTLYLDIGHNDTITNIDFVECMPKLQVAIVALSGVSDLSPLANCPDLEYLETFTNRVTDLSPLASCTNLEHLNIGNLPKLSDITPLYGLTKLKRLRICPGNKIPQEQIDTISALLPECDVMLEDLYPTGGGWRRNSDGSYAQRYALLREQMGYDKLK